MPDINTATVVSRADDGAGIEFLVVIAGSSSRWDGLAYHVT